MFWLWETLTDLVEAMSDGDRSWWTFIVSVLVTTAIVVVAWVT